MSEQLLSYVIDSSVDTSVLDEICRRTPYCSENILKCEPVPGEPYNLMVHVKQDVEISEITAQMDQLVGRFRTSKRLTSKRLVHDFSGDCSTLHGDIGEKLSLSGLLSMLGSGQAALFDAMAQLVGYFDSVFLEISLGEGARRVRVPSLIPIRVLERLEYIQSFPHHLTYVSNVRQDQEAVDRIGQGDTNAHLALKTGLLETNHVLSPNVCFHIFHILEDTQLDLNKAQDGHCFVSMARCFRHEAGRMRGLERLWEFSMSENVYVGTQSYALEGRDRFMNESISFIKDIGLAGEVVLANDAFFTDDFHYKADFQLMNELKYELQLPFSNQGENIAVASFNYHMDHFSQRLGIGFGDSDEAVHSSCAGWGLERLALAFVARHGLDIRAWPRAVRRSLREN